VEKKENDVSYFGWYSIVLQTFYVWNLPLLSIVNVQCPTPLLLCLCMMCDHQLFLFSLPGSIPIWIVTCYTWHRRPESPNIGIRHYRYCDYSSLKVCIRYCYKTMLSLWPMHVMHEWPQPGLTSDHWSLRNDVTIGNRKAAAVLFVPMVFQWNITSSDDS